MAMTIRLLKVLGWLGVFSSAAWCALAQAERIHRFSVSIDPALKQIDVRACFDGQPPVTLVAESLDAPIALISIRNEATGEETVLTAQDVQSLKTHRIEPCNPKVPTLLLLDAEDEVLDYRVAETALRGCGKTIVYPGGSHRFEHLTEALPEIRALYAA